jgi:transposase-like protein
MSLEAIGDRVGRHPSTVSYWLNKHGLRAGGATAHAPKGRLERSELEALVGFGLSIREIAAEVGRSATTVRYWLGAYGLTTRRGRRSPAVEEERREVFICRRHGETAFVLEGRGYYRCMRCRAEAVAEWRRVVKGKLVEEAGGRCALCGYSRCQRALHFHHLDPSDKKFHLGDAGATRSLARSRVEALKCVLLCANCHSEVEAGMATLPVNSLGTVDPG